MEVYTLDSLLRREEVVDRFTSLIWTERFAAYGDFELILTSTRESRELFVEGRRLVIPNSERVMTVETVEDLENAGNDGKDVLKVKGRSMESILLDRVAKDTMSNTTTEPKWVLTGTPGNIARQMFDDICRTGTLSPYDVIPFVMPGTINSPGTIEEPVDVITREQELASLYKAIKDVSDLYDLGFRLIRPHLEEGNLYFEIYSGNNRTTGQTDFDPVIFAPGLHNLQNVQKLASIENAKNVAYVFSPVGFQEVVADDVDADVEGFERRVLLVNATDVTSGTAGEIAAALIQKGKEELSKHRAFLAFDGEIDNRTDYIYGRDYELGDLVEMRTSDGVTNNMRVTEQIFVCDQEGQRSYPTLAVNKFIYPGSWSDWMYNQYWADFGLTDYWADQP
jgi:hypothetical protein